MKEIDPPGIVRADENHETCLANAAALGRRVVTDSLACGEWLLKAKAVCPHGQWLASLAKYGFSERTAQRLMAAARNKHQIRQLSDLDEASIPDLIEDRPSVPRTLDSITGELYEQLVTFPPDHRDGPAMLRRALNMGELLSAARERVGEEQWWTWFDATVDFTRSLGEAYMHLHAEAGSLAAVSLDDAIRGLGDRFCLYPEPIVPSQLPAPTLPEPLAILGRAGLLDDDALVELVKIRDDYGSEILEWVNPDTVNPEPLTIDDVLYFMNCVLRPLDRLWPIGSPNPWKATASRTAALSAVLEAVNQLQTERFVTRRGAVQCWERTALFFGSMAALCHSLIRDPGDLTVARIIRRHVAKWRQSLHTALYVFLTHDRPERVQTADGKPTEGEWWGYHSDLRHAGILEEVKEIKEAQSGRYPALVGGYKRFRNDVFERGTYLLPSAYQEWWHDAEVDVEVQEAGAAKTA
jgi:hypothetical protein